MPQTLWTWSIAVDWDNDNSFLTANDDITASVINLSITNGMNDDMSLVASVGTLTLTLKNADMKFSPKYASSIYFGKMLPGLPVRVQVTHLGSTYTIFRGYTADFTVTPGAFAERQATITAVDGIERLQAYEQLSMPLQVQVRSDTLATAIVNSAYLAPAASATVTIAAGNVANNDTITFGATINGAPTTIVYTFKTTLTPTANEIKIGAANTDTATNLAAAINNATGSATLYAAGTSAYTVATASVSSNVVTITSTVRGTVGNAYTLAKSGANITLSGATLSGGLDYPTGLTSYETGIYTFDYAGDGWATDTNGLTALQETVNSEQGMFFAQLDGTLTYWNRDEIFKRVTTASSVVLGNSFQSVQGGQLMNDVYNRVEVKYSPRSPLTSGIVAKATSAIQVPGQSGSERWNGTVVLPGGGNVVQKLQATDPTTQLPMGIVSIVTPLVPSTDWTANTARDGSGIDYTTFASLFFSVVRNSDSVEVSIQNTALDSLYVLTCNVRGIGVVKYNPVTIMREDSTYQSVRGRRLLSLELPFGFSGIENYADALAQYWLGRFKNPDYRIKSVTFSNEFQVASFSLFSLTIGATVSITETQAQLSASKHMIIGFNIDLSIERTSNITLNLKKLDDTTYWILGDATYGVLGSTTRLAI